MTDGGWIGHYDSVNFGSGETLILQGIVFALIVDNL